MKADRLPAKRGRGADKEVKRRRDKHPADQQLYSNIRVRSGSALLVVPLPTALSNCLVFQHRELATIGRSCLISSGRQLASRTMTGLQLQLSPYWQRRSALTRWSPLSQAHVLIDCCLLLQDPQYLPGPEKMFGPVEVKHFPEVAAAGFEVLRQQASYEELKRYLRKQQDRQLTAEASELVTFELVYLLAERVGG